jgi:hypothetical protein
MRETETTITGFGEDDISITIRAEWVPPKQVPMEGGRPMEPPCGGFYDTETVLCDGIDVTKHITAQQWSEIEAHLDTIGGE